MATIVEHLGVRLSPEPVSPMQPPSYNSVDTPDLRESKADSTTSSDDSLTKSAPF